MLVRFASVAVSAAALLLGSLSQASAGDAYFLLLFGQQRIPNDPDYSHTFATFVRVSWDGNGPCPPTPRLEAHTISWLPSDMQLRWFALLPECGRNFDLHTTLRRSVANRMRTSLWGPYQIHPALYEQALRQESLLVSGQVRYKVNDIGHHSDCVSNCVHAVSGIVDGHRLHIATPGWGETASFRVLRRLEPWLVCPDTVHPWVGSALGLDQYPIVYRDWANPWSGALVGPVYRLFGGECDVLATYGQPPAR